MDPQGEQRQVVCLQAEQRQGDCGPLEEIRGKPVCNLYASVIGPESASENTKRRCQIHGGKLSGFGFFQLPWLTTAPSGTEVPPDAVHDHALVAIGDLELHARDPCR